MSEPKVPAGRFKGTDGTLMISSFEERVKPALPLRFTGSPVPLEHRIVPNIMDN